LPSSCHYSATEKTAQSGTYRSNSLYPLEIFMGLKSFLTAITITCAGATSANATTILYDFTDNFSDDQTTVNYVEDGYTVDIEAGRTDNPGLVRFVNRGNRGLGVSPGSEGGRFGDNESLTFTFGDDIEITGLVATIWERGTEDESFSVIVNGVTTTFTLDGVPASESGNGQSVQTFDLTSLFSTGTNTFSFVGESSGPGNRGVRIGSIQVDIVAVPVPAGGGLLLTGLLGLGYLRQRQRR
jgi:hypothetical protein